MRIIILDTETTGISTKLGHRIIEIACIEMINRLESGNVFHTYVNPERNIPSFSTQIHGITNEKVADKPKFSEIVHSLLDFIGDSEMVIHNAIFDIGFLNFELQLIKRNMISLVQVIDTLKIARKKFPGSPASLDALCKRFDISLENRKYHGALLDSQLLARVYLELTAESQSKISFFSGVKSNENRKVLKARKHSASQEEMDLHKQTLKKIKNPLWNKVIM